MWCTSEPVYWCEITLMNRVDQSQLRILSIPGSWGLYSGSWGLYSGSEGLYVFYTACWHSPSALQNGLCKNNKNIKIPIEKKNLHSPFSRAEGLCQHAAIRVPPRKMLGILSCDWSTRFLRVILTNQIPALMSLHLPLADESLAGRPPNRHIRRPRG